MCTCEPDKGIVCGTHSRVNRIRYPSPNVVGLAARKATA